MSTAVLVGVLIVALLVGIGAVVFYNAQDYTYSLDIEDDIPTSDVYATSSSNTLWNGTGYEINESNRNIQSISVLLGKMKFKNEGVLSRVVEVPRLIACADLTGTAANTGTSGAPYTFAFWPIYTTYEPVFSNPSGGIVPQQGYVSGSGIVTEISPQYAYGSYYGQQPIEVKAGDELVYYISLRDSYITALGRSSNVFKNGNIEVYELPTKEYNPISPGVTYDSLVYNPTCDVLAREFDPVEAIEII